MSEFSLFLKKNKAVRKNTKYAPTKSLLDTEGKPLEWEFRHLTTKEDEQIRDACTKDVQVTGKTGVYRKKVDTSAYMSAMIVRSCVNPNLNNKELQDSYGMTKPEDLLKEMVDDPGEFQELSLYIQKYNGFDSSMDDEVGEAKN